MGRREIFITISIILFTVVFVVLFILSRVQPNYSTKNTKTANSKTAVVVDKSIIPVPNIVNDPLVYDGLTIEADSKVTDWITKRVFTVGTAPGLFGTSSKQLIVVAPKNFELPKDTKGNELGIGELSNVHLKGKVRIMDKVELGRAMGIDLDGSDIKLDDGIADSFREGSVLLLDSVEKL